MDTTLTNRRTALKYINEIDSKIDRLAPLERTPGIENQIANYLWRRKMAVEQTKVIDKAISKLPVNCAHCGKQLVHETIDSQRKYCNVNCRMANSRRRRDLPQVEK